ncbi:hypothetical protein ACIQW5_11430 [Methylorubrum thiocyanatum]|uniref:hypothetical protein n=1 Tax=Methylorubrum thiocyanatum TaxID=47958 RepID=UPI00383A4148
MTVTTCFNEAAYVDLAIGEATQPAQGISDRLSGLVQEAARHFMSGVLSEDGYNAILAAADARKARQRAAQQRQGSIGAAAQRVAVAIGVERPAKRAPDRPASPSPTVAPRVSRIISLEERAARDARIARRRYLAKCARIPALIARHFTVGETAVLGQVAFQVAHNNGECTLSVDALASRAKVCRRVVQSALRRAFSAGFLIIYARRRQTNLIRLVASDWIVWNRRPKAEKTQERERYKEPSQGAEICKASPSVPSSEAVEAERVAAEVRAGEAVEEARRLWAEERSKQTALATVRANRSDWSTRQEADPWREQWPFVVSIADRHIDARGDLTGEALRYLADRLSGRFSFRFQTTRSPAGIVVDRPVIGLRDHLDAVAVKVMFG